MNELRTVIVDSDPMLTATVNEAFYGDGRDLEFYAELDQFVASGGMERKGCLLIDPEVVQSASPFDASKRGAPIREGSLVAAFSSLQRWVPTWAIVLVTHHPQIQDVVEVVRLGAVSVLEKPVSPRAILDVMELARTEGLIRANRIDQINTARTAVGRLTDEELRVMELAADGQPNKAISYQLDLSPRTVDRRRHSALSKLEVASVAEFAVLLERSRCDCLPDFYDCGNSNLSC